MNEDILRQAGLGHMVDRMKADRCAICDQPNNHQFRDDLSKREFEISGMCQHCQDQVFKDPDEKDDDDKA